MEVTVIIPAYNYGWAVAQAVESALRQERPPAVILVVDDGSTDNTAEVLRPYVERGQIVYHPQANAGLSAARNTGIRLAQTPWVALLDADDRWHPAFLRRCAEEWLAQGGRPHLVATASRRINLQGEALDVPRPASAASRSRSISAAEFMAKSWFYPSCVVAQRAALLEAGLFDTTLRSTEDRDMWIRVALSGEVFWIDEVLVDILKHGANMSRHADRMLAANLQVLAKYRDHPGLPRNGAFWAACLAYIRLQSAWRYYDAGRPATAAQEVGRALCTWPWPLSRRLFEIPPLSRPRLLARSCLAAARSAIGPKEPIP